MPGTAHGAIVSKAQLPQDTVINETNNMNTASYMVQKLRLGSLEAKLYSPVAKTPKSSIAIVTLHAELNYMDFDALSQLAEHGYMVLGSGPVGNDEMESKILCVKQCVDYVRSLPDIKKVILLGHSGGATLMTAYQFLAENGVKGTKGMIFEDYTDAMNHLTKADGVLLLDANWGMSTVVLNSLDANIIDEQTGELSSSPISQKSGRAYMKAQQKRYMNILENAMQQLKAGINSQMNIPGAESTRLYNKLYTFDLKLLHHTKEAWPLIHDSGRITSEIVHSVRAPLKLNESLNPAITPTLKGFLSVKAIHVDDDYEILPTGMKGIRWTSNLTTPIGNVAGITVPLLAIGMTGSWEYLAAESIYEFASSRDKQIAFVEGAGHMLQADRQAEEYNHINYGNTLGACIDYVDKWLSAEGRFIE